MYYLYIEIRYFKQLSKIVPGVAADLQNRIVSLVCGNGGALISNEEPYLARFDPNEVGAVFGCACALAGLLEIFETYKRRAREYTVLCASFTEDSIAAAEIQRRAKKITADRGVFVSSELKEALKDYLRFSQDECERPPAEIRSQSALKDGALSSVVSFAEFAKNQTDSRGAVRVISGKTLEKLFTKNPLTHSYAYSAESGTYKCDIAPDDPFTPIHLYPRAYDLPFRSLREAVRFFNIEDADDFFDADERELFAKAEYATSVYDVSRFDKVLPNVTERMLFNYFKLSFEALSRKARKSNTFIVLFIHNAQFLDEKSAAFLKSVCAQSGDYERVYVIYISRDNSVCAKARAALPSDLEDLLQLCVCVSRYTFSSEAADFFLYLRKDSRYFDAIRDLFYRCGFLDDASDIRSFICDLDREFDDCRADARVSRFNKLAGEYLWEKYRRGELRATLELYLLLTRLQYSPPFSFIESSILNDYENGLLENVRESMEALKNDKNAELAYAVYNGYAELYKDGFLNAAHIFERASKKWTDCPTLLLGRALSLYNARDYEASASVVKNALGMYQRQGLEEGEIRALCLLACLSFSANEYSNVIDYYEYALQGAERIGNYHLQAKIRLDMAVVCFMMGNLAKTLRLCASIMDWCDKFLFVRLKILSLFVSARAYHVCGEYDKAEQSFALASVVAARYDMRDELELCKIWRARSLIYLGKFAEARETLVKYSPFSSDARLFLIELFAAAGMDADAAKQYSVPPENLSGADSGLSGFSFIEDRCIGADGGETVAVRLKRAYTAFVQRKFPDSRDAALSSLYEITRETKRLRYDPESSLYYFLYYIALTERSDSKSVDCNTVLGRAFKCLQERSACIDAPELRDEFMRNSFWNSRLYAEARINKLI